MYYCLFVFPVWIQGQEHQKEEGEHCGVCGRSQGDAEEETEGMSQETNSEMNKNNHSPLDFTDEKHIPASNES